MLDSGKMSKGVRIVSIVIILILLFCYLFIKSLSNYSNIRLETKKKSNEELIGKSTETYVISRTDRQVEQLNNGLMTFRVIPKLAHSSSSLESEVISLTDRTFNFNTILNELLVFLNMRSYEITDKYISKANNLHAFARDPLIILALSRVESGVYTDINKIYSASIPTLGEKELDMDSVDTIGAKDVLMNDEYWKRLLPYSAKHQGPLQMGINYGVQYAIKPEDLKGRTEENELLPWRYLTKYNVPSSWYSSNLEDTGDRYNWADASNRVVGMMNKWAERYNEFENVYDYLALCGMAHNVGGTLFTGKYSTKVGANYFPWKDVGSARIYAKQIASLENISRIREIVLDDIYKWREGIKSTPDSGRGINWSYSIVETSQVDKDLYTLKGDYKNRLGYPIRCLYYYLLLEELYFNGG